MGIGVSSFVCGWLMAAAATMLGCRHGEEPLPADTASVQRGKVVATARAERSSVDTFSRPVARHGIAGRPDSGCSVPLQELRSWLADNDVLVIDMRPSLQFRRIRIPESVNFTASGLRTKAYLKNRHLLLVDHGYRWPETRDACRLLRAAGFRHVRALPGGLQAWAGTVGPLAGDRAAEVALRRLSPYELDRSARLADWFVIDVSAEFASGDLFAKALHVPLARGEREVAARLQAAIDANESGDDGRFVILTDRDGTGYPAIERMLDRGRAKRLYFLDGGLDAYRTHRIAQAALLAQAAKPPCLECGR
jgi:rhodanese-related sulfurtransferase